MQISNVGDMTERHAFDFTYQSNNSDIAIFQADANNNNFDSLKVKASWTSRNIPSQEVSDSEGKIGL